MTISILVFFISVTAFGTEKSRRNLLRDGFVLAGVDGKLTKQRRGTERLAQESGLDRWFFEFDSDVSDDKGRVSAGESVELLPSAALEKMTADMEKRSVANYRLWGRVTKYKGNNFIFGTYFLPLSKVKQPEFSVSQKPRQQVSKLTINEPNDVLAIPQEIMYKLQTRRPPPALNGSRPVQLLKKLELKTDFILADRTGFIIRQPDNSKFEIRNSKFVFNALGRNVPQTSFKLLPCEVLELAELTQSAEPDPLRFKIAGIVTKYKGRYYLLLQKATRVYSHGNFID